MAAAFNKGRLFILVILKRTLEREKNATFFVTKDLSGKEGKR